MTLSWNQSEYFWGYHAKQIKCALTFDNLFWREINDFILQASIQIYQIGKFINKNQWIYLIFFLIRRTHWTGRDAQIFEDEQSKKRSSFVLYLSDIVCLRTEIWLCSGSKYINLLFIIILAFVFMLIPRLSEYPRASGLLVKLGPGHAGRTGQGDGEVRTIVCRELRKRHSTLGIFYAHFI